MPTAQLTDRTVLLIEGPEAEHFLQNIVTTDLDRLGRGEAKPGALLSPQGKILFDFLIARAGENGFRLDCRAEQADDLARRLTLYRLRARVEILKQDQTVVLACWQDDSASSQADSSASQSDSGASETDSGWLADLRFPAGAKVLRRYGGPAGADAPAADFARLRIAHGIAESGADFEPGDAFPHDVLMDETGGVGFQKGCYVGQEVVSRMQHRGTARRRVMIAQGEADLPEGGAELRAGERAIGALGSVSGRDGLAIVRIDKVKDALGAGVAITAGGVPVRLSIPGWARYTLPQDPAGAEEA